LALRPLLPLLRRWSVWQRTLAVAGLYLLIGFWAASAAAPGNIEGRGPYGPSSASTSSCLWQPEIIVQGAAMSLLVAHGIQRL